MSGQVDFDQRIEFYNDRRQAKMNKIQNEAYRDVSFKMETGGYFTNVKSNRNFA